MLKSFKARAAAGFVVVLSAGMLLGASPASAASNADNAKLCQKGGWETVQTATGDSFKNQGDCVSYTAQGGQFLSCFDSTNPGYADFTLVGPINTFENANAHDGTDGTCTAVVYAAFTVVAAADLAAANAACTELGAGVALSRLADLGYSTVPSDWYECSVARFV